MPQLNTNLRELNCSYNQIQSLPPLPEKLEILYCSYNLLTNLPQLPKKLNTLWCSRNQLIQLPPLNPNLLILWCSHNQLTSLPPLNLKLEELKCWNNQLTSFPNLNPNLKIYDYEYNPIWDIIYSSDIDIMKCNIQILNHFKDLFYSLKYKKQFRDLLWIKVREPRIQQYYHPNNLEKILLNNTDDTDDKLFSLVMNW